jgi:hypothetical protein
MDASGEDRLLVACSPEEIVLGDAPLGRGGCDGAVAGQIWSGSQLAPVPLLQRSWCSVCAAAQLVGRSGCVAVASPPLPGQTLVRQMRLVPHTPPQLCSGLCCDMEKHEGGPEGAAFSPGQQGSPRPGVSRVTVGRNGRCSALNVYVRRPATMQR